MIQILNKYKEIAEKRDTKTIIPFLKSLSEKEKELLRKEAIKEHKQNKIYRTNNCVSHYDVQAYVHFFCFKAEDSEYLRMLWRDLPKLEDMEALLKESIPPNFPELFAAFLTRRYLNKDLYGKVAVQYKQLMPWLRNGYIAPLDAYIAMRMDEIFPRNPEKEIPDTETFIAEQLKKYPEILSGQIYFLFRYPNEASYADKLGKIKVGKEGAWTYVLRTQTQNGKLDRLDILRECLTAMRQNFKKDQLNWYVDLFEAMKPANTELLALQDDLFATLYLPLTKAINMVLGQFKHIADTEAFRTDEFLQIVPQLLSGETKAIANSALATLEKIALKNKELRESICISATNAFLSKEEAIQIRASKLIVAYGETSSVALKETLQIYNDKILMSAKTLIAGYLAEEKTKSPKEIPPQNTEIKSPQTPKHISPANKIKPIENTEELIFQSARALNNFEEADFYLIPDALYRLSQKIDEETVVKLSPAIQKAYKLITDFNPARSFFLQLTAFVLFKTTQYWLETLSATNIDFRKLKAKYEPLFQYADRWFEAPTSTGDSYMAYEGFKKLVLFFIENIKCRNSLPILSIPTHRPTWIEATEFILRLKKYQEAAITPDNMDIQQAMQLCSRENTEEALSLAEKELTGEYKNLIYYLLDNKATLPPDLTSREWWLTAAIVNPGREIPAQLLEGIDADIIPYLQNQFNWKPYTHEVTAYIDKDPETGEDKPFIRTDARLEFNIERYKLIDKIKDLNLYIAYTYVGYPWAASLFNNMKSLMLASPNNWQSYLAKLANEDIQYASDTIGKHMTVVLEVYRLTMMKTFDMDIMYLTLCFMQKDKTLRAYLGEIWAEMSEAGLINNRLLGKTIGRFAAIEYAPLKRFTDTIQDYMIKRSIPLNQELETLIDACMETIGEKPIANIKKLQAIRKELKALNEKR